MSFSTMDELNSFLSDPKLLTRLSKDGRHLNLTHEELLSVARALGGKEWEQYVTGFMNKSLVSSDRIKVDPLGDSKDVHIHPLNDCYNIVYWGGDGAEAHRLWTFQISRSRPINRSRPVVFDPARDYPVNLKEDGIAVFMPCEGGREKLKEGLFMAKEGGIVHVDITSTRGTTTIPVTFPTRLHHQLPPGNVVLPL